MYDFKDKVALVTGASRGIGRAVALRIAQGGGRVAVNYAQDRHGASEVVSEIARLGGTASAFAADVSRREDVIEMVEAVGKAFGPIDILVNNAGVASYGSILTVDDEEIQRVLGVNLFGSIYTTQAVAPSMMARQSGSIVNVSSVAGLGAAAPQVSLYAISKAALNMLTKRMALELGDSGIRVNGVCPGGTKTTLLAQGSEKIAPPTTNGVAIKNNILGRIAEPSEIAEVIAFIAGPNASYLTGQIVTVDGGVLRFMSQSA